MTAYRISRQIRSSLEDVDAEVNEILDDLDSTLGVYNRFSLDLLLRESLNNAVLHGNQGNPDLQVFLSIILVGDWFHIRIEDQGEGFDWTSLMTTGPDPASERGRGFPIIKYLGEELELNAKGNKISFKIAKDKPEGTE